MPARILQTTFVTKQDAILAGIDTRQITAADKVKALDSALARYSQDMPRLSTLDFAGTGDAYYVLSGQVVRVDNTDRDAQIDLTSAGNDRLVAVAFTLPRRMTVQAARVSMLRTGAVAGTVSAQIRLTATSLPTSLIVASSNALDADVDIPLGFEAGKVEFVFATPPTLEAGTYQLVIVPSGYTYSAGVTVLSVGVDQSDVTNNVSTYDGAAWAAYGTASVGVIEVIGSIPKWDAEWSSIKGADIPAPTITSDEQPQTLEDEDFTIYRVGETQYLYLPNNAPATTDTVRLNYSSRYTFDGSPLGVDVPAAHFDAVAHLSAYFVCRWLSVKYGQSVDGGLNADMIDRRNQSDVYASRARELESIYTGLIGIGGGDNGQGAAAVPAMKIGDMDRGTYSPRDFLFHGKRRR